MLVSEATGTQDICLINYCVELGNQRVHHEHSVLVVCLSNTCCESICIREYASHQIMKIEYVDVEIA